MTSLRKTFREMFGTDELYDGAARTVRRFAGRYVGRWHIDGGSDSGHARDVREALSLILKEMEKGDLFYLNKLDVLLNEEVELEQGNRRYEFGMDSCKAYPAPNLSYAVRSMIESKGGNGWGANPYKYIIKDILDKQEEQ